MGCGSSSLKGDKVDDLTGQAQPAMKKIRTNFSEVDFSGDNNANGRRGTVALAPDEQHGRKVSRISEAGETPGATPAATAGADIDPLAPSSGAGANTGVGVGIGASTVGTSGDGIVEDAKHHHHADGSKLEPYRTIEGDNGLESPVIEKKAPEAAAQLPQTSPDVMGIPPETDVMIR